MTFRLTMCIHLFSPQKPLGDEATAPLQSAAERDHRPASAPKHSLPAAKQTLQHSVPKGTLACKRCCTVIFPVLLRHHTCCRICACVHAWCLPTCSPSCARNGQIRSRGQQSCPLRETHNNNYQAKSRARETAGSLHKCTRGGWKQIEACSRHELHPRTNELAWSSLLL